MNITDIPLIYFFVTFGFCWLIHSSLVAPTLISLFERPDSRFLGIIFSCMLYLFMWHSYGAIHAYLDSKRDPKQYWWVKYKIHYNDELNYWDMLPVVLWNQFVTFIPTILTLQFLVTRGFRTTGPLPSIGEVILHLALAVVAYEVVFYWSHRAMHTQALYPLHALHHKTKASVGISGMYASPLDSFLMTVGAGLAGPVVFNSHVLVLWLWFSLGAINSVHSHGGYELPFMPSPRDHESHHSNYKIFFGLGVFDYLCGTEGQKSKPNKGGESVRL